MISFLNNCNIFIFHCCPPIEMFNTGARALLYVISYHIDHYRTESYKSFIETNHLLQNTGITSKSDLHEAINQLLDYKIINIKEENDSGYLFSFTQCYVELCARQILYSTIMHTKTEKVSYGDKLKNPQWQKKRLKIFERDNWSCCVCHSFDKTLHVHHLYYKKDRDPWDYDDEALITYCEDCHNNHHEQI